MKFYQDNLIQIYQKDCSDMSELPDESVDLIATDPPYGISFMGKDWDRALPDKRIWAECLRVLKPGAFAFVMSIPRADCLSRMIISLEDAGFLVNFTPIFWAYASGFPKAQNIGKAVDKRLGAERTKTLRHRLGDKKEYPDRNSQWLGENSGLIPDNKPQSPQAQALDGSYGGFQPKPSVEVIIVAMKPLSEKTFVDQALKNQKGITWLDDCRVPYESEGDKPNNSDCGWKRLNSENERQGYRPNPYVGEDKEWEAPPQGRFPANLLVSDDVLNDGRVSKTGGCPRPQSDNRKHYESGGIYGAGKDIPQGLSTAGDSGSFSRYFDLDKWWAKTFPFLIVPKASKSEKNKGLGPAVPRTKHDTTPRENEAANKSPNYHPTVKPLKLMSYLITLGSREGDTVVDNFGGSGTTAVAARLLGRKCIMYEIDKRYCEIAVHRLRQLVMELTS